MARSPSRLRMPLGLRLLVGALLLGLAAVALHVGGSVADPLMDGAIGEAVYDAVLLASGVLCLARAALHRAERRVWAVMGAGLVLYAGGNVYWSFAFAGDAAPFYPSISDGFWLLFYPAAYIAVVMLVRERLPHLNARLWLDGLIALLVTCALSAAVVVDAVQATTGGALPAVVTNLAYPIGDAILIGLVLGAMAAGRGRLDRTWLCFGLGTLLFAAADSVYVYQAAKGTYVEGALLDLLWPAATVVIGAAAWQPAVRMRRADHIPGVVVPVASALTALGVLVYDHFACVSHLAVASWAPRCSRSWCASGSPTARAAPTSSPVGCRRPRTP